MKIKFLALLTLSPIILLSQSLDADRVSKLKSSVVRVFIDNQARGTGFFISQDGWIATCWHVIESAIMVDTAKKNISLKKMMVELSSGENIEVGIMTELLYNGYLNAKAFDYCLLKIQVQPKTNFSFLKIGSYSSIREGEQIYTCGYPFGIKQQVIASGMLSTKWTDTLKLTRKSYPDSSLIRNVAWLDLTMNKGNSGGPIIKLGNTINEDEVIGISTFILNPFAKAADDLLEYLSTIPPGSGVSFGGINFNELTKLFGSAIANNSVGVSGCISIDHMRSWLNTKR